MRKLCRGQKLKLRYPWEMVFGSVHRGRVTLLGIGCKMFRSSEPGHYQLLGYQPRQMLRLCYSCFADVFQDVGRTV